MEIKKADSKGRVTGFTPKTMYHVSVSESGTITCTPIRGWESLVEVVEGTAEEAERLLNAAMAKREE